KPSAHNHPPGARLAEPAESAPKRRAESAPLALGASPIIVRVPEGAVKRKSHAGATTQHTRRGSDSIATRRGSIWDVHFGLPGVETTLTLLLNAAVDGRLSLERVVELYSSAPAQLYGLYPRKGSLEVGADADFVLVDLSASRV